MPADAGAGTEERLRRWQTNWDAGRYSTAGRSFHQADVHPVLRRHLGVFLLGDGSDDDAAAAAAGQTAQAWAVVANVRAHGGGGHGGGGVVWRAASRV